MRDHASAAFSLLIRHFLACGLGRVDIDFMPAPLRPNLFGRNGLNARLGRKRLVVADSFEAVLLSRVVLQTATAVGAK